jgi:nucleotide-binding universal stress UspA family protein
LVEFRHIVCAIDFSGPALAGLEYAMSLAEETDARLTLLHAFDLPPELSDVPFTAPLSLDTIRADVEADRRRRLGALIPAELGDRCRVETPVGHGRPSRAILAVAREQHADLIVMGVHGRGAIDRALFGSNTHHVIRAAECPVLTVRSGAAHQPIAEVA